MYLRELRDVIGLGGSKLAHLDLQRSRIQKDKADVESLVDLMENTWLNPKDTEQPIHWYCGPSRSCQGSSGNSSSRRRSISDVQEKTLRKSSTNNEIPHKMTKQNFKTFSNVNTKKASGRGTAKEVVLKVDINLFGHMTVVAQSRQLHMGDVLAHPLGPLPWALANADGSLRKMNKVALTRELERNVSPQRYP